MFQLTVDVWPCLFIPWKFCLIYSLYCSQSVPFFMSKILPKLILYYINPLIAKFFNANVHTHVPSMHFTDKPYHIHL